MESRATVGHMAVEAVGGERQVNYGTPSTNFYRVIMLWNAYLQGKYGGKVIGKTFGPNGAVDLVATVPHLDERDYGAMMRLVKEARLMNGYHEDSLVDICGYAICDQRVEEGW